MKRPMITIALATLALATFLPVLAEHHEEGEKPKFTLTGELRARYEYFENLADFTDEDAPSDFNDDNYGVTFYRANLGARGEFGHGVSALIQVQNVGYWGDEPPFRSFQDPNFQYFGELFDEDDTNLYQAVVMLEDMFGSGTDLMIGRQEHALGNELHLGDLDFYNGQSFDGLRGGWGSDKWRLEAFHYQTLNVNAGCTGFCGSDNSSLTGVTFNYRLGDTQVIEPYLINFKNGDEGGGPIFFDKFNFATLGARWTRDAATREDVESSFLDWSLEVALQDGDIGPPGGEEDHSAYVVEGWLGFNFLHENSRSRVHLGLLMASGDDDAAEGAANDGDHEDYLFLFPDFYENNRLGDGDLESFVFTSFADAAFGTFFLGGVTDLNVGYRWMAEKQNVLAAYHMFTSTEEFCASPGVGCEDDLGSEIDLRYGYQYSHHFGFDFGLAQFMPGDLIEAAFGADDDAMRVYAQGRLKF